MRMQNKGFGLSTGIFAGILTSIIAIIIIFQVLGDTASDVGYAADNITHKGESVYPLTNFFKKKGIVLSQAAACC